MVEKTHRGMVTLAEREVFMAEQPVLASPCQTHTRTATPERCVSPVGHAERLANGQQPVVYTFGVDQSADTAGPADKPCPGAFPDADDSGDGTSWHDVSTLLAADSPRLGGENPEHVQALAEILPELPPILVNRSTHRVIDGMHRLRAAQVRGDRRVRVRYVESDPEVAFLLAVMANVKHGLPLTLSDRKSAARRIAGSRPAWSDRLIAGIVGLSPKTVGAIRSCDRSPATARIGKDGRVRPLDAAAGRDVAREIIAARPDASLREMARMANVSPSTVRDVRSRMSRGDDPLPPRVRKVRSSSSGAQRNGEQPPRGAAECDVVAKLNSLKRDPALRLTDDGRVVLRWLDRHTVRPGDWQRLLASLPPHAMYLVYELARGVSREWQDFAESMQHDLRPPS